MGLLGKCYHWKCMPIKYLTYAQSASRDEIENRIFVFLYLLVVVMHTYNYYLSKYLIVLVLKC